MLQKLNDKTTNEVYLSLFECDKLIKKIYKAKCTMYETSHEIHLTFT